MIMLYQQDGEEKRIDIPIHVSEIAFGDFCDFRTHEQLYFQARESGDIDEAVNQLITALQFIFKGDLFSFPLSVTDNDFELIVKRGRLIEPGDNLTINLLYGHFHLLVNSFTPDRIPVNIELNHEGNKYTIVELEAVRVLQKQPLSVGEVIEVMEIQRRSIEAQDLEKKIATGNIDFTLGLTEFAILVRQPGERLPAGRRKLDAFINARRELFKTLPLDSVLAIRFFLLNTLLKYSQMANTNFSGRARLKAIEPPAKRNRKQKNVLRKLGT